MQVGCESEGRRRGDLGFWLPQFGGAPGPTETETPEAGPVLGSTAHEPSVRHETLKMLSDIQEEMLIRIGSTGVGLRNEARAENVKLCYLHIGDR